MRRVRACLEQDVRDACGMRVTVEELEIALFRRGGVIFALNNVCAHQHVSLLHQGQLDGMTVTCPMHGWTYDLRTGTSTTGQGAVACYPVSVEGGVVYVELPEAV